MSSKKTFTQTLFTILPILLAGLIAIGLSFYLSNKTKLDPLFADKLLDLVPIFIGISMLFTVAIMSYLYYSVIALKKLTTTAKGALNSATVKMHKVRNIVEILLNSKIWLPGLQEFIDQEFEGLTYFEVKNFYKGKSKLAIEFLQENHNFYETENLYLEMKSMLLTQPNNGKVPATINYPDSYGGPIIEHWIQHKIGSGLWYFFGYKFANFKELLKLENVHERQQDKIMSLAMDIDPEAFEENSFNEVFLSKLGEYITKKILPSLYEERTIKTSVLPLRTKLFTALLGILIISGVVAPLLVTLLELPILILIISYSFICTLLCYISIAFYQFLKYEITR